MMANGVDLRGVANATRSQLTVFVIASVLVAIVPAVTCAQQQPAPDESEDLAKQLSNPISDLVSVPFQFNWQQKVGPLELSQFLLNVQPVIPFTLTQDWNMILRIIFPFVGQPPIIANALGTFGVGDLTTSFFFSPVNTGKGFTVGFGPAFVLPADYDPTIGSGRWSVGPTAVGLQQTGPWTVGALWNQVWSFAGDERRADVNQMFLQPFLAYQANKTITLTIQSETTADWTASGDDRWTVPINFQVSKLSSFGTLPASYLLGYGVYPVHPDFGPSWKIRGAIVILLPRKR